MCEELPIYESSSQKTTFFLTANENILLTGPVSHRSPSFLPAFFDSFSGSTCSGMGYTSFGCPLHNSVESILSFCLHFLETRAVSGQNTDSDSYVSSSSRAQFGSPYVFRPRIALPCTQCSRWPCIIVVVSFPN